MLSVYTCTNTHSHTHAGDRGYSSGPEYGKWGGVGGQGVGVTKRRPRAANSSGSRQRGHRLSDGGGSQGQSECVLQLLVHVCVSVLM